MCSDFIMNKNILRSFENIKKIVSHFWTMGRDPPSPPPPCPFLVLNIKRACSEQYRSLVCRANRVVLRGGLWMLCCCC